jgi:hypothetical protein
VFNIERKFGQILISNKMPGGTVINAFGTQNRYGAKPPENGSFPIDHKGKHSLSNKLYSTYCNIFSRLVA